MQQTNIQKWNAGDWNVICDICGKKRKRTEVIPAYGTGLIPIIISCKDGCADQLHPLNFPPPVILDGLPVPDARPEALDQFINNNTLSIQNAPLISGSKWKNNTIKYQTISHFSTDIKHSWVNTGQPK